MARDLLLVVGGFITGIFTCWLVMAWSIATITQRCGHCGQPVGKHEENR